MEVHTGGDGSHHRHLDDIVLARMADAVVEGRARLDPLDSTLHCSRCVAILGELVRARLEFDHGPHDADLEIWAEEAQRSVVSGRRRRRAPRLRWAWTVLPAAALAFLVLSPLGRGVVSPEQVARARSEHFALPGLETAYGRAPGPVMRGPGTDTDLGGSIDDVTSTGALTTEEGLRAAARHITRGELSEAESYLHVIQASSPDDPGLLTLRAVVEYRRGDEDLARWLLDRALEIRPGDPVASFNLAKILCEAGDARGRELLEKLESLHPDHPLSRSAARILRTPPPKRSSIGPRGEIRPGNPRLEYAARVLPHTEPLGCDGPGRTSSNVRYEPFQIT